MENDNNTVNAIFSGRNFPSQINCNAIARTITGKRHILPIDDLDPLTYTVLCRDDELETAEQAVSVIFAPPKGPGPSPLSLPALIYPNMIPQEKDYGPIDGANPPLSVYVLDFLPGRSCAALLFDHPQLSASEELKLTVLFRGFATYFCRGWVNPRPVSPEARTELQRKISQQLTLFHTAQPGLLAAEGVEQLFQHLPELCLPGHHQVFTNWNITKENTMIDPETFHLNGFTDWRLLRTLPFGMELSALYSMSGCMHEGRWVPYTCCWSVWERFWGAIWEGLLIRNPEKRRELTQNVRAAARIGAILRHGFKLGPEGQPVLNTETADAELRHFFVSEREVWEGHPNIQDSAR